MSAIKGSKGVLDLADPIMMGFTAVMLYVGIMIFNPFADLLATSTVNMTNSGIFMSIVYLIPIMMVVLIIVMYVNKAKTPGYQ